MWLSPFGYQLLRRQQQPVALGPCGPRPLRVQKKKSGPSLQAQPQTPVRKQQILVATSVSIAYLLCCFALPFLVFGSFGSFVCLFLGVIFPYCHLSVCSFGSHSFLCFIRFTYLCSKVFISFFLYLFFLSVFHSFIRFFFFSFFFFFVIHNSALPFPLFDVLSYHAIESMWRNTCIADFSRAGDRLKKRTKEKLAHFVAVLQGK